MRREPEGYRRGRGGWLRAGLVLSVLCAAAACGGDRSADAEAARSGGSSTAAGQAAAAPGPTPALAAAITASEQHSLAQLPAGPGQALVQANCTACHSVGMIVQQHKDATAWNKTLTQMRGWGAPVTDEQQATLAAYLTEHFGPVRPGDNPILPSP